MDQASSTPSVSNLPRNVKVLGLASLLNDAASEMIFPLLPNFLLTVLLGNRFSLGVIEGAADLIDGLVGRRDFESLLGVESNTHGLSCRRSTSAAPAYNSHAGCE